MFRKGLIIVVCGPSGVGKGTLLSEVLDSSENMRFSVSATTRAPREGEIEGVDYFFKTHAEFEKMINDDELVEWVKYVDNYYGTPGKPIEASISSGTDIVLDIEVEGAQHIKKKYPDSVLIFIFPPSLEELKKRIEKRGTENVGEIEKRLIRAKVELSYVKKYDYVVINDDKGEAINEIKSIILSEKLKVERNSDLIEKFN
ncbi:MAG: guanylate kinase [Clostridia bacterium]|jgi:guanylate kinase